MKRKMRFSDRNGQKSLRNRTCDFLINFAVLENKWARKDEGEGDCVAVSEFENELRWEREEWESRWSFGDLCIKLIEIWYNTDFY